MNHNQQTSCSGGVLTSTKGGSFISFAQTALVSGILLSERKFASFKVVNEMVHGPCPHLGRKDMKRRECQRNEIWVRRSMIA